MKLSFWKYLFVFGVFVTNIQLGFSQETPWKIEITEDGVEVSSRFSRVTDNQGVSRQVIEYRAKKIANVNVENCVEILQNPERHKEFMENVEVSKKIKDISEVEYSMYYLFSPPWPMPDADCVMQLKKEVSGGMVMFRGFSIPDQYPKQGVNRMIYNNVEYQFTRLINGVVSIEIYAKMTPANQAPDWLVGMWFPEGPQKMINGLINNAKK